MTKSLSVALAIEAVLLAALLTIAADQIVHTHVERLGGVNIWGYRGPVLNQKQGNELRIAVTGGDLAFGWGVAASETLAPSLRDLVKVRVDPPGRGGKFVTAVTTGARGLAPAAYATWIDHLSFLRPDVVCLVPDPIGHLLGDSPFLPNRRSVAFAAFGYSPILPLVLQEKGKFTESALLRFAGNMLAAVDEALGRRINHPGDAIVRGADYVTSIDAAVRAGQRSATAGVVVVLSPANDNSSVKARLASTFADERMRVVDLGDDPRMRDPGLRLDGFSFSTGGHAAAAEIVAPAVLALLGAAGHRTP